MAVYIGIDNGLKGGMAVLDDQGNILLAAALPLTVSSSSKNCIDVKALDDTLTHLFMKYSTLTICVEKPAGSKSYRSAVSMADSFARIETLLTLREYRRQMITANKWQKEFWTGKTDNTKAAALTAVSSLWPDHKKFTLRTPCCSVSHDGIVDALLIAEYCRRTFGKNTRPQPRNRKR